MRFGIILTIALFMSPVAWAGKASTFRDAILVLKKEMEDFKNLLAREKQKAIEDFQSGKKAQLPREWEDIPAYKRINSAYTLFHT